MPVTGSLVTHCVSCVWYTSTALSLIPAFMFRTTRSSSAVSLIRLWNLRESSAST